MNGDIVGWSYIANTIESTTQTRSSSETSFLREALVQTPNLQVYKNTLAKSITFDDQRKATGVNIETAGMSCNITANREVIVSAGAFRSPQLLMVSGVGPKAILDSNGIDCIADRPGVGQNMWVSFIGCSSTSVYDWLLRQRPHRLYSCSLMCNGRTTFYSGLLMKSMFSHLDNYLILVLRRSSLTCTIAIEQGSSLQPERILLVRYAPGSETNVRYVH